MELKGFSFEELHNETIKQINAGSQGERIIAFVDLLGFSEEIKTKWQKTGDDSPLYKVMRIKTAALMAKSTAGTMKYFDRQDISERILLYEIEYPDIITISDSFVLIQEIKQDSGLDKLGSLLTVMTTIMEIWRFAVEIGYTVRGAISIGDVFYTPTEIIGPGFIEVYELESRKAEISRIILSEKLNNLIDQNIDNIHPIMQQYFYNMLYKDIDGFLCINPVPTFNNERYFDYLKILMDVANSMTNHKAKQKYYDLIKRLQEREFTLSDRGTFK
jgi:hypothetical protein